MKTFRFLSFLILLSVSINVPGQNLVKVNVSYSINIPAGNFREYIRQTSFRGYNASITYSINRKLAIGATTGFQDFYQKNPRAVYKYPDGTAISAVVSNSIQTIPILATMQYTFLPEQPIQPYGALGIGGNFIMHSQYHGQFGINRNKFGLAVRPEIGLFIPIKKYGESGVNIAGAYNFMPYKEGDVKSLNSWGISVGAKFPVR